MTQARAHETCSDTVYTDGKPVVPQAGRSNTNGGIATRAMARSGTWDTPIVVSSPTSQRLAARGARSGISAFFDRGLRTFGARPRTHARANSPVRVNVHLETMTARRKAATSLAHRSEARGHVRAASYRVSSALRPSATRSRQGSSRTCSSTTSTLLSEAPMVVNRACMVEYLRMLPQNPTRSIHAPGPRQCHTESTQAAASSSKLRRLDSQPRSRQPTSAPRRGRSS